MQRIVWLIDDHGAGAKLGRSIADNVMLTGRLATYVDRSMWSIPAQFIDECMFVAAMALAYAGSLAVVVSDRPPIHECIRHATGMSIKVFIIGVDCEPPNIVMSVYTDNGQTMSDIADAVLWTLNVCRIF